jgi:hypothetical protein
MPSREHEPDLNKEGEQFPLLRIEELQPFSLDELAADPASPKMLEEIRGRIGLPQVGGLVNALRETYDFEALYQLPNSCLRIIDVTLVKDLGKGHHMRIFQHILYTDGAIDDSSPKETTGYFKDRTAAIEQKLRIANATLIIIERRTSIEKIDEQLPGLPSKLFILSSKPKEVAQYMKAIQASRPQ